MLWILIRSASLRALLMSTHNICFRQDIRKIIDTFWLKNGPYQELCLKPLTKEKQKQPAATSPTR